jgi:hypothetical protein
MGTYKIAPDSTGPIGMAQMKRGLVNKADYNHSQGVTTEINMNTLVVSPTSYQGDLTSKTWNTSQPLGFNEMYGQTWNDAVSYSIIASTSPISSTDCSKFTAFVSKNGTQQITFNKNSGAQVVTSGNSFTALSTDTILVSVTTSDGTGVGCIGRTTTVLVQTSNSPFGTFLTKKTISGNFVTQTYSFNPSATESVIRLAFSSSV